MLHKATLVKHLVLARESVTDLVRMSIRARIKERRLVELLSTRSKELS